MNYDICIYHKDCIDGFTSAWVAHKAGVTNFLACDYKDNVDAVHILNQNVLIVDFSFPAATLHDMGKLAKSITILDHHENAGKQLAEFHWVNWEGGAAMKAAGAIRSRFDVKQSGARLTWRHLFPDQNVPALIDYVQDRDLWKFELPKSRQVNSFIGSFDFIFSQWDYIHNMIRARDGINTVAMMGQAIERDHAVTLRRLLPSLVHWMSIGGYVVPAANVMYHLASDAGHLMCTTQEGKEGKPAFAATYFDLANGKRKWSLRSEGDFDVSAIARMYGGNGHKNAAGFVVGQGYVFSEDDA